MYDEPILSGNAPELIENVLRKAASLHATDIHFDSASTLDQSWLTIRFRVDGMLRDVAELKPGETVDPQSVLNALKISSNLDVSEKRKAHDGRFSYKLGKLELDIRVATVPTFSGEKIALRLIDKQSYMADLEQLNMPQGALAVYQSLISSPQGFVVIAGPTGCGKTTTLYSTLKRVYNRERNIISIEDPVECRFPGINQIQVDPEFGVTFAGGLRAILRLDPDIVMIGEIRDVETARIAFNAALTGCLMFSTLHAKNAINSIARLLDMGVEPFLLASGLSGIVSQRLVRLTCTTCGGKGCVACFESGFRRRIPIYEVVKVTKKIQQLILKHTDEETLRQAAIEEGMVTFEQSSRILLERNLTTDVEIARVVSLKDANLP